MPIPETDNVPYKKQNKIFPQSSIPIQTNIPRGDENLHTNPLLNQNSLNQFSLKITVKLLLNNMGINDQFLNVLKNPSHQNN